MGSSAPAVSTGQFRQVPASDKTQGHVASAAMRFVLLIGFVLLTLLCSTLVRPLVGSLIRSSTAFLSSHFGLSDKAASCIAGVGALAVAVSLTLWQRGRHSC